MSSIAQVELIGGPMNGCVHELNLVFGMPARIGFDDDDTPEIQHWYELKDGKGHFVESKRKP